MFSPADGHQPLAIRVIPFPAGTVPCITQHRSAGVEQVCLRRTEFLNTGHHDAVCFEIVPLVTVFDPAYSHQPLAVRIVPLSVGADPFIDAHRTVFFEQIRLASQLQQPGLHNHIAVKVIPLSTDILPALLNGTCFVCIMPASVSFKPAGLHHSVSRVKIIVFPAELLPADIHLSRTGKTVPASVYLLPAGQHYAVSIQVISIPVVVDELVFDN